MLNVEIHGYPKESRAPDRLRRMIKDVLCKMGLGGKAVVTIAHTETEECNSFTPAPFLRIISDDLQEPGKIIYTLEAAGINMDVEVPPPLARFKPAEERWNNVYDPPQEELGG